MIVFKSQKGVSLLEVMLVLGIISSITLMGIRFYQQAQKRTVLDQLQANVDQLFLAAAQYYQANCYGHYNAAGTLIPGDLNPTPTRPAPASATVPSTVTPFVLTDLDASLVAPGYLKNFNNNPVLSIISDPGMASYVVQFNPVLSTANGTFAAVNLPSQTGAIASVYCRGGACAANTFLPNPLPPAGANFAGNNQAIILTYRIQIAVKLLDPSLVDAYRAMLGAYCVSDIGFGGDVIPCESVAPVPPTNGGYLVWERLPSMSSPNITSSLTPTMPLLKQFNLQYTHDQMYEMGAGNAKTQYYLCGA